jgi:molecular chaperone GrpE (heat shock protein)
MNSRPSRDPQRMFCCTKPRLSRGFFGECAMGTEQYDRADLAARKRLQAEVKAYRERAARMRADAERTNDRDLKRQMLELADSFDGLAESAEALRNSHAKPG